MHRPRKAHATTIFIVMPILPTAISYRRPLLVRLPRGTHATPFSIDTPMPLPDFSYRHTQLVNLAEGGPAKPTYIGTLTPRVEAPAQHIALKVPMPRYFPVDTSIPYFDVSYRCTYLMYLPREANVTPLYIGTTHDASGHLLPPHPFWCISQERFH